MRAVRWCLGALVALAAGLAWWSLQTGSGELGSAAPRAAPDPRASAVGAELRSPDEQASAPVQREQQTVAFELSGEDQADAGSQAEPLQLILRGRVLANVDDLESAEVRVRRSGPGRNDRGPREVVVHAQHDGTFEVDATPLLPFNGALSLPPALEVTALHPRCLSRRVDVALNAGEAGGKGAFQFGSLREQPDPSQRRGRKVYEVEVRLESCARIFGHVDRTPVPEQGYEGVWVAALRFDEHGRPHSMRESGPLRAGTLHESLRGDLVTERARTDHNGDYALKLKPGARYALVALERDCRPATAIVDVELAGSQHVNLLLEEGDALEGILRVGREPAQPWIGISFALATPDARPIDLAVGLDPLVYSDGRFEWARRLVRTDEHGRFRAIGLGPNTFDVQVLAQGQQGVATRAVAAGSVRAPAHGLELGPLLSEVVLQFEPRGEQPVNFSLRQAAPAGEDEAVDHYRSQADGSARLWLPPGTSYEIESEGNPLGRVATSGIGERVEWVVRR